MANSLPTSLLQREGFIKTALQGLCLAACFFWTGCSTGHTAVKTEFNFSSIRSITVSPFSGPGGQTVSDEFVREFIGMGLGVTDASHAGQVIFKGNVTEYKPNNAWMVFLGSTTLVSSGSQTIVVNNPVVSLSSARVTEEGSVLSVPHAQVASVNSVVGVTASLVDAASGQTVWSGSFSYEALDLPGALQVVVKSLAESLGRNLPQRMKQPA